MRTEQLREFTFLEGQPWQGSVSIVKLYFPRREEIGVQLRLPKVLGTRALPLPRRGLAELARVLLLANDAALDAYKKLLKELNDARIRKD